MMIERLRIALLLLILAGGAALAAGAGPHFIFDSVPALAGGDCEAGRAAVACEAPPLFSDTGPLGRPVAMLTFRLDHALWGGDPQSIKRVNVVWHLLCALALYLALRELLAAPGFNRWRPEQREAIALVTTAVWALHPLHVSTVLYAVQRMSQLAMFFGLLAMWHYLRMRTRWTQRPAAPDDVVATALWLALLLGAAVLAKETAIVWLALLALCESLAYPRALPGRWGAAWRAIAVMGVAAPALVVIGLLLLQPAWLVDGYFSRAFDLQQRFLTQLRLLWHYVGWLLLPDIRHMTFHHDVIEVSRGWLAPVSTLLAGLAWLWLVVFAWWLRRRFPLLLFGVLFFLLAHASESTVLPLEMAFEHRNYLPAAGILLVLSASLVTVLSAPRRLPYLPLVALGAALVLLGLLALRAQTWRDELAMSATHAAYAPQSPRSQFQLANTLLRRGEAAGDAATAQALIVQARDRYERMYALEPAGLVAPVSLFYIDSRYFPGLLDSQDWFARLRSAIDAAPAFSAQDRNAIELLLRCLGAGYCQRDATAVAELFEGLAARGLPDAEVLRWRARYAQDVVGDPATAVVLLEQAVALQQRPSIRLLTELIAAQAAAGDVTAAITTSQQLLVPPISLARARALTALYRDQGTVP